MEKCFLKLLFPDLTIEKTIHKVRMYSSMSLMFYGTFRTVKDCTILAR